ncbi:MAG: hypothetical protein ACR65O_10770 [Methylomicrobium sp.]
MKKAAVAFIDILGFKGIWQRMNPNDVLDILKGVKTRVLKQYETHTQEEKWYSTFIPEVTVLSDTIVIVIRSDDPKCIFLMPHIINDLAFYFYGYGLFFRGAIGYGDFEQEDSTFIGPVIDDVASWYEAADWIGTILTPKTNYLYDRFENVTITVSGIPTIPFIKYLVPGKNGKKFNLNCLNLPAFLQASYQALVIPGEKSKARAYFEQLFSQQSEFDASVLLKYENTIEFIDYSISMMSQRTVATISEA